MIYKNYLFFRFEIPAIEIDSAYNAERNLLGNSRLYIK